MCEICHQTTIIISLASLGLAGYCRAWITYAFRESRGWLSRLVRVRSRDQV
jgi:hypothetical protein